MKALADNFEAHSQPEDRPMKPLFTHFVYALGLVLCMCQAGGAGLALVSENPRIAVDLTGEWLFRVDPKDQAQTSRFIADDPDLKDWACVMVPCGFGQCVPGVKKFSGVGWFRKEFNVPEAWRGKRLRLTFDAVNNSATFFFNGKRLEGSHLPYLPVSFDLQSEVRFGQKNVLVVKVSSRAKGNIPYHNGWYNEGGILRDVRLQAIGDIHVEDVVVVAPAPEADSGKAHLTLEVSNRSSTRKASVVRAVISDSNGRTVGTAVKRMPLDSDKVTKISLPISVPDAVAWSPATPVLYTASVDIEIEGTTCSQVSTGFGFRTVEVRDSQVLLNGDPIYMAGFNRHEDTSWTGMARNTKIVREDLQRMKRMGVNFMRCSHYPNDAGVLDLCDEMGILVMIEMPIHLNGKNTDEGAGYLKKMIRHYKNHPCIIFWSVSNEQNERDRRVVNQHNALIKLTRKLDPTRLAVHVSGGLSRWVNPKNHPLFAEDDVICVNGYPSRTAGLYKDRNYDFSKSANYWKTALAKLHQQYPGKPILVTEFGHPTAHSRFTPNFPGIGALGPQIQKQVLEADFRAFDAPYICGALIWCWADHPWPAKIYQSEDSPFGVLHRDRRGKGANVLDAIENMFKERLKSRTLLHEQNRTPK